MKEKTIVLPADLSERRAILKAELSAVVEAQVTESLEEELKELLNRIGFTEGTATVEWDFYSQYDDEGGFDKRTTDYAISVNGESIEVDGEFTDSEEEYDEIYLRDWLSDVICGYSEDLYESDIYEITITLH